MIWTWQRRCEFLVTTKGSFRNHDSDTEDHVERIYILLSNPTAPPRVIYFVNHHYNKIVKSDWLSTALISALIGQFNRTVRVMPK